MFLAELAEVVRPGKRLNLLRDPADNRILECVVAGVADAIVTGDKSILAVGEFEGIRILSSKEYLESN